MTTLGELAGSLGLAGLGVMLWVLGRLSRKLGEVTKMRPDYVWCYVAAGLVGIAFVSAVIHASVVPNPGGAPELLAAPAFYLWTYHLPLAAGLAIGLIVAFRYWSWLLIER